MDSILKSNLNSAGCFRLDLSSPFRLTNLTQSRWRRIRIRRSKDYNQSFSIDFFIKIFQLLNFKKFNNFQYLGIYSKLTNYKFIENYYLNKILIKKKK